MLTAQSLFGAAAEKNASDLHLIVGHRPVLRISGELYDLDKEEVLTEASMEKILSQIVTPQQMERFRIEKELDLAYANEGVRFRVNLSWERGHISLAARTIPQIIPTMDQLELPPVVQGFTELSHGLILVTGPTSAGKSTTLAAMIDDINAKRRLNIITLEDPVEFLFDAKQSIIRQRQLESDMVSFAEGLKHVLRQDPDVVMVGEMRDLDTIATTLTLAETGHLVFATLHTFSAPQTVSRIIDVFPPHQQTQIRLQLAMTLRGVISQQLLPRLGGGLVATREILVNTPACANLIRENKVEQIKNVIQTGAAIGMTSYAQDLKRLVKDGLLAEEVAENYLLASSDAQK
ncbi:MAG: PilT/PilU family type 4a pilus ATPase [Patescibacteria group bacterium]|nr:MAG: PilT/PilU family type 4a pilus ATPase [Patescibacteria group bacterium]